MNDIQKYRLFLLSCGAMCAAFGFSTLIYDNIHNTLHWYGPAALISTFIFTRALWPKEQQKP